MYRYIVILVRTPLLEFQIHCYIELYTVTYRYIYTYYIYYILMVYGYILYMSNRAPYTY